MPRRTPSYQSPAQAQDTREAHSRAWSRSPAQGYAGAMTESERRRCSERLRLALDLFEAGVEMQRARWTREEPSITPEQLEHRLQAWLRSRPPHASSDGVLTERAAPR